MKHSYEELREMASLSAPGKDKIVLKNKKGVVLKPLLLKWGNPTPTYTRCMSMAQVTHRPTTQQSSVARVAIKLDIQWAHLQRKITSVALANSKGIQGHVCPRLRLLSIYFCGRFLHRAAQISRQDVTKRTALLRRPGPERPRQDH